MAEETESAKSNIGNFPMEIFRIFPLLRLGLQMERFLSNGSEMEADSAMFFSSSDTNVSNDIQEISQNKFSKSIISTLTTMSRPYRPAYPKNGTRENSIQILGRLVRRRRRWWTCPAKVERFHRSALMHRGGAQPGHDPCPWAWRRNWGVHQGLRPVWPDGQATRALVTLVSKGC